jgi:hypothetical protein
MKNVGFKKPGIRQWVSGHPGLNQFERERVIEDNEHAVENTKRLNLPIDRDFGSFDGLESMAAAVPEEYKRDCLFIIRCPHRTKQTIERKLFVPWSEVVRFVEQDLPGGYKQYKLGLREVSQPVWSGTVVSSKGGDSILLELWKGKHLEMDDGDASTSFRGIFNDDPNWPRRFVWSDGCTDEMKDMMLTALRYLAPNLRPDKSLFAEFSIAAEGKYLFHGVSFDPYWTERRPVTKREIDGD